MKIILKISLLFLLVACHSKQEDRSSEKEKASLNVPTEEVIDTPLVLKHRHLIQAAKELQTRINAVVHWPYIDSVDVFDESSQGGQITLFNHHDTLVKIKTLFYGEMGQSSSEFYARQGHLTMVYEKQYSYNRPLFYDSIAMHENNDNQVFDLEKSEVIEFWTYFKDGKLVLQTNNQEDCPSDSIYLRNEEERLLEWYHKGLDIKDRP